MTDPSAIYQDMILEHARRPHGLGPRAGAERVVRRENQLCGDAITLYVSGLRGRIDVSFVSDGCALCRASASVLVATAGGRDAPAALALAATLRAAFGAQGPVPPALPEAVRALLDLSRYPTRERCVLLPWDALTEALAEAQPK